MELYDVVLFAHIAVLLFAFALTGAIHVSMWLTVRAGTVQEMRVLAKPQRWGFLFAPVVALLLGLGGWLVKLSHDRSEHFSVSDGWAWTAAVVLLLAFVLGIGLEGPHADRLGKALAEAPDGPVTPELLSQASAPLPWVAGHAIPFMILAVAANMVNKPSTAIAVLDIVVGAAVGALIGALGLRLAPVPAAA